MNETFSSFQKTISRKEMRFRSAKCSRLGRDSAELVGPSLLRDQSLSKWFANEKAKGANYLTIRKP